MTSAHTHARFVGLIPILATPFHDDESLDLESLARLIRFNIEVGANAVTVLGLLGESNRLTDAERVRVISTATQVAGAIPVIVGTSHSGTAATVDLSQAAIDLGASAVMVTPSEQPVPSDRLVTEYFQRIAARISAPIILQDQPAVSRVHMSVDLILRLVKELPTIAAIKAEAQPSPRRIAALRAGLPGGRRPSILTGLGALYCVFDLESGSDGLNTGFAFPEVLREILSEFRRGDVQAARTLYARFLPLLVFEQQPGVAIRKEILRLRGLIASNRVRHPGGTVDATTAEQLATLIRATFAGHDLTQPIAVASKLRP